jgi:hypothetical protein
LSGSHRSVLAAIVTSEDNDIVIIEREQFMTDDERGSLLEPRIRLRLDTDYADGTVSMSVSDADAFVACLSAAVAAVR